MIGAAGFIGSHLCRHLGAGGAEVHGIDRRQPAADLALASHTLSSYATPEAVRALEAIGAEQVFLLAGTAAVGPSLLDPIHDLHANATALLTFLELLRATSYRPALVYVSSAAVYGEPTELPMRTASPTIPISPYGVSKLASEMYLRMYGFVHGFRVAAVRPFSVYGPGLRKQVVWDVLEKLDSGAAVLRGTGAESRDFVHVSDVCSALATVAAHSCEGQVYNVCSSRETTIAELGEHLCELTGVHELRFDGLVAPGNPVRWRGDHADLSALGWTPRVGLEEGLAETVLWYRQQHK